MNKRHGMIAVALVALLLITGCSTFFTGGVSGKVFSDGDPVVNATVALYFDEAQRNADWKAEVTEFNTDYQTQTGEGGRFSIPSIPWDSAFPEYGKDADCRTAYALVYHKDYGYLPVDGITVISGRPNEFFPDFHGKKTNSETVYVKFLNPETKTPEPGVSQIKITYKGCPGFTDAKPFEKYYDVIGGIASFDITYQGDTIPKFDIVDIKYNTYDGNKPRAAIVDKDPVGKEGPEDGRNLYKINNSTKISDNVVDANNTVIINAIPLAYDFRGFNGIVTKDEGKPTAISIYDKKKAAAGNPRDTVFTVETSENHYLRFEGLGSNITLVNKEKGDYQTPETKGYPAIIEDEFSIFNDDDKNVFTASSNPKAITSITVNNGV